MTTLFISHSTQDLAATEQVKRWLISEGFQTVFVDYDEIHGIPGGSNWERSLYASLRSSDGLIFLGSSSSVASRWCFLEVSLARSLGRPVFPLILETGGRLDLLDDVQWIDFSEGGAAFTRLRNGLKDAGLHSTASFHWDRTRSPYPGLRPFDAEDAAVFFGRENEVDTLRNLLQPTLQRGPGRFIAIIGPSGSGKSSLMRAGLLPRLERQHQNWVVIPPMRPGKLPFQSLARSLGDALAIKESDGPSTTEILTRLERGPAGFLELVAELSEMNRARGHEPPSVLLAIDQAEELVTLSGAADERAFLDLLVASLKEADILLWAIATVRSEHLATAPDRAGIADAIDDPLIIEPVRNARLAEVIAMPARRAGIEFELGLIERMVNETAGGDALPLLAYTLSELYERRRPDGMVTIHEYEAAGGVVGSLRRRADRLLGDLTRRGHGSTVIPTLLKLVTTHSDGEAVRRRVARRSLSTDEQVVVDALVDARLLVSDRSGSSTATDREIMLEVAHEALLRQWTPLCDAIEASREWLSRRSELERLATDWDRGGRGEAFLLRGERLTQFDQLTAAASTELEAVERQFLDSSRQASQDRERLRVARLLAAAAETAEDPSVALALAVEAYSRNEDPSADRLVRSCLGRYGAREGHASGVDAAAVDWLRTHRMRLRDWSVLPTVTLGTAGLQLSVDRAGQATFVALGGTPLVLDEEPVLTAAVDDGARLACVVTASGRLMIVGPDGVHATAALGIPASAVALDGTAFMATVGCDDGSVRILWFSDQKMSVETLRGPQGFIEDVAIAPSASHVAALTQNGRLHVWDTRDGGHRTERPLWRVAWGGSARHGWCQLGEDGADAVLFGDQGAFRLPLSRDALVAHARQVQPRTLTDEDWMRYIGEALN